MTPDEFFEEILIPAFNIDPRIAGVEPAFVNVGSPSVAVWDVEMDGGSFQVTVARRP